MIYFCLSRNPKAKLGALKSASLKESVKHDSKHSTSAFSAARHGASLHPPTSRSGSRQLLHSPPPLPLPHLLLSSTLSHLLLSGEDCVTFSMVNTKVGLFPYPIRRVSLGATSNATRRTPVRVKLHHLKCRRLRVLWLDLKSLLTRAIHF